MQTKTTIGISCVMWTLLITSSLPSVTGSLMAVSTNLAAARQSMQLHSRLQSEAHLQSRMQSQTELNGENPTVKKVVRLLEDLLNKNTEQGKEEDKLEEERACRCIQDLAKQKKIVDDLAGNLPALEAEYTELAARVHMLQLDIKRAQKEADDYREELKQLQEMYEKAAASKQQQLKDYETNMVAIQKAIDALRKGLGGSSASFLQTSTAESLRKLVGEANMSDNDRDVLAAFLDHGSNDENQLDTERPGTEEVIGILRQMLDTMNKDYYTLKSEMDSDYRQYLKMRQAKQQQIAEKEAQYKAMNMQLTELVRRMVIVEEEIKKILGGDYLKQKALYDAMKAACDAAKAMYDKRRKLRAEEAKALTECISLLSSDEAQTLFKKTLPSASSLLQMKLGEGQLLKRARSTLQQTRRGKHDYRTDFIAFLLMGKKVDMTKVNKMIDDLIKLLNKEAQDDLNKKDQCDEDFGAAKLESMRILKAMGPVGSALLELRAEVETCKSQIASLEKSLKDLDKTLSDAAALRKEQYALYMKEAPTDQAAMQLLRVAQQRLTNFYGLQLDTGSTAPKPPTQNAEVVLHQLSLIYDDLKSRVEANKLMEQMQQEAYDDIVKKAGEARTKQVEMLEDYKDNRARATLRIQKYEDENRELVDEQMAHDEYIMSLHKSCDWLLKAFDYRKQARVDEIDSLNNAKAVLNGADLSLIQEETMHHQAKAKQPMLRGSASS